MFLSIKNLILILLPLVLAGCNGDATKYKIAVSQCASGQWREKANREMQAAQHLYERHVEVNICEAGDDPQRQIRQIDSLAETGIDLLVVAPAKSAPVAEAVGRVRKRGIPVVFFDRKADTDDYTAFIGGNNEEAGLTVGRYALLLARQIAGRKAVVLEITGGMGTSPAQERHRGFMQAMKGLETIDYQCMETNWEADSARAIVKSQIASGRVPDIVFCHNDAMGMGAWQAASEMGADSVVHILGIDGMPDEGIAYVEQGILAATYIYPTNGQQVVRLALNILTSQSYDRDNSMQGMMVTPDNVDIIAKNSRELLRQGEDLITIQDKLEDYLGLYNIEHKLLLVSLVSIVLLLIALLLLWMAARQRRKANEQMKRLSNEQTLFYNNASHQLKTPLTLIAGPVKELSASGRLTDSQIALLDIVGRNVKQLETLISSVLNFRKEVTATITDATASAETGSLAAAPTEAMQESRLALLKQEDTDELPSILIVDDNADMRYYLRTLLADKFYVLEAANGQDGLRLARDIVPDVVVTDVMMPVMDGLQLCRKLKEDQATSHIPVVMLTSRSTEAQQVDGYEHGADAYLTKPFSAGVLVSRIYNLVRNRRQLLTLFATTEPKDHDDHTTAPSSQDKLFAEALKQAITHNMQNPNLKMEELGTELGLSRVQLYRKVKALTGLSPVELLRQMRLERGRTLLTSTTKTVAEVAYEVGFGTPGYFSKCFKQQFGQYPTELRAD